MLWMIPIMLTNLSIFSLDTAFPRHCRLPTGGGLVLGIFERCLQPWATSVYLAVTQQS